ncbi:WD40 repeat-like protein [Lyophyllum atratum]|nr:WD40 repeat-like protein [Lyophyllum atratum]
MNPTTPTRHRRHSSHPGFSHLLTTVLGSPFLTTPDLPELVDGAPVFVAHNQTVTRPSSPTPTVGSSSFSFIQFDPENPTASTPNRPPLKSIIPRIWDVISPSRTFPPSSPTSSPFSYSYSYGTLKGRPKPRYSEDDSRYVDYSELAPLDGEEGELIAIDDEACFFVDSAFGSRAVTGIDILALLPTELALQILTTLCATSAPPTDSLHALLTCRSISRTWRSLAEDNTVWRALFLARWNVDLTRHTPRRRNPPRLPAPSPSSSTLDAVWSPPPNSTPTTPLLTPTKMGKMRMGVSMGMGMTIKKRKMKKLLAIDGNTSPSSSSSSLLPLSSSSSSPSVQQNLEHAPLQLNWQALYRTRLELERRWTGTAPSSFVFPSAHSPQRLSARVPPPTPTPAPFTPQILSIAGHTDSVYCLEFDGRRIITGSRDRTIKVWSLRDGRLLGSFGAGVGGAEDGEVGGHTGSVLCLKFSADWDVGEEDNENEEEGDEDRRGRGKGRGRKRGFMVSGSSDCSVCVWDLWTGARMPLPAEEREVKGEVRTVLRGHVGGVLDLRIDENWIVSCSKDAVIHVWNRKTLALVRTLRGHEGPVNAVGLQSGRVVSASGDGKMILWDIKSGERIRTFEGHDRGLACIEFKDDLIVSGSNDCKIKVWSATTGECIRTLVGHEALVRALAFDPKNRRLVSASYDKTVKVWDLDSGKLVREFKNTHTSHIFDVKFDAARIVSTSHDQKIVVIDFSQGLDTTLFV